MSKCPEDSQYYWSNTDEAGTCTSHVTRNTPHSVVPLEGLGEDYTWCTRKKGHAGDHHCHNNNNYCIRTWTQEEELIEAL